MRGWQNRGEKGAKPIRVSPCEIWTVTRKPFSLLSRYNVLAVVIHTEERGDYGQEKIAWYCWLCHQQWRQSKTLHVILKFDITLPYAIKEILTRITTSIFMIWPQGALYKWLLQGGWGLPKIWPKERRLHWYGTVGDDHYLDFLHPGK